MLLRLKKNKKGFTLIELIVVVAIIAILAAIAVPSFISMQARATEGTEIANATAIAGAINTYNALSTTTVKMTAYSATTLDTAGLNPGGLPTGAALTNATRRLRIDANGVATVNTSNPYVADPTP